ncbi:hypothetical protein [Massilia niastensis]|uniref:hypothetical protein n=1 Tax=Massilia niastensis TaxID=544911 RepID=UPI00037C75BB|nr:hypothetical protein [Massilia niastensis]
MLTSTYTLVALSVEQARARVEVQGLLDHWRPGAWWGEAHGPHQFEQACEGLRRAYESCHWRKLDKFVLPALRRAGGAADGLLLQLEAISRKAAAARASVQAHAANGNAACLAALARCCELLLERLDREERELFPLARTLIPGEAWFAIANQMLAHDAHQHENRAHAPAGPAPGPAAGRAEYAEKQSLFLPLAQ